MSLRQLGIGVTFLAGRYHGDQWPPAPARLFQALVGGVMTCGYKRYATTAEPALRWLEKQKPPMIRACDAAETSVYRIAVPNNDMDVVAARWVQGRSADPAALRTMKSIRPKELGHHSPHVQYLWNVDDGEAEAMIEPLRVAARCLHTFGWGIDMAFADIMEPREATNVYEPARSGEDLAVPMAGTLDDLYAAYQRFISRAGVTTGFDTHTRPSLMRMQPYRSDRERVYPVARFMLLEPSGDEIRTVAWENCMQVAGWLRHAAARWLANEYTPAFIQEYIQGHTKEDEKAQRISYVPLPSIYGKYGDGLIRRVLIVEPAESTGEVTRMLRLKLTGRILSDVDGNDTCSLAPSKKDDWTFEQYLPQAVTKVWRSVTPVVLHGFNTGRPGKISISKTERLLLRAFEMAGYRQQMIESLTFQTAPWWPGTKHASAIRVPEHLNGFPRLHVEVHFRCGVRGPVLAGLGRHYGIGLFAKWQ